MSTEPCLSVQSQPGIRERGVTLVELMVALAIGSLLIVGAVAVYVQSRNTYRVTETAARLQEVARYALDVIEPDVRLAGFWGLTFGLDTIDNAAGAEDDASPIDEDVSGTNCGPNWTTAVEQFIEGRDEGYDLDCPVPAGNSAVDWTDVLIIRRASSDERAPDAGRIQIQSNRVHGVLFSDGVVPLDQGFGESPASQTRDLVVHAYYVAEGPNSANGTRQFALRRKTLVGGASPAIGDVEIIPGIQDLQVQFGIDEDADATGATDRYVDPEDVPANTRITSVRIWLLAVADEPEVGFQNDTEFQYANADYADNDAFTDDRRRVLVTKTIQIRNSR